MTTTTLGLIDGMSNVDYQAHPALSSSGMKALLECPARFKWNRENPVYKDIYDFGSAWHKLALNDESETLVVVDADSWRTKAAREARDEARAANKIPILVDDLADVQRMIDVLHAHREATRLLSQPGRIEQSAFWIDEKTGVELKARFDLLPDPVDGQPYLVVDGKTAASSDPQQWMRKAPDYGYPIQDALYRRAVRALDIHDRPDFAFVVQEKEPPHIVTVIRLDAHAKAIGDHLVDKAIRLYAECMERDEWPGYIADDDYHVGSLPKYYTDRFEGLI